jgi:hypothetical protein
MAATGDIQVRAHSYAPLLLPLAPAAIRLAWYLRRAMTETVFNKVVRLVVATTPQELEAVLGHLPHGVRFGVAHQLDEVGEAYRYESSRHCAYYLSRQDQGILVWRWSYVASQLEAIRLRGLVASLEGPLDAGAASRAFEHATLRSVGNPRPIGMDFHALDFGPYPALYVNGAQRSGI